MRLYINVDHVATVRQARRTDEPDPVEAARLCEAAGAHGITAHLREDRRHVQDDDIIRLSRSVTTVLNVELDRRHPELRRRPNRCGGGIDKETHVHARILYLRDGANQSLVLAREVEPAFSRDLLAALGNESGLVRLEPAGEVDDLGGECELDVEHRLDRPA